MRRALLLCTIVLTGLAGRTEAQQGATLAAPPAPPVTATAAPHTIQVFLVPVPNSLFPDRPVAYTVTPAGGATIIPPLRGIVASGRGDTRSVMIAASVPTGARAGAHIIAAVQFSQGALTVSVPLELRVSQTHGATLRLVQQLFGAQPRERVIVNYVVTNTGNAPDTLDVTAVAPSHWASAGAPRRYALGVGETASGTVTVTVPRVAESGVSQVKLVVAARTQQLAAADAVVQLLETPTSKVAFGPKVVAGMASVLDDGGRASPVLGLEVSGPVTDQIQALGRLVQATNPGAVDQRGLARVGYFVGAPFLTLATRDWQATGGYTGRSFSDVTGTSAYGRGVSLNWSGAPWSIAALAADPISAGPSQQSPGHLAGLRVGHEVWRPGAAVNATVTDLVDPQLNARRLHAVGIGAESPAFSGMTASGELAQRWYTGGEGLGWVTEFRRQTPVDFGQLRVVHAPGGSAAFAHAQDEISATGSRMVSKWVSIAAGAWTSDDDNATFSRLHTQGWSLSPRFDLTSRTSLLVEARSNVFDATSAAGSLGNGETVVRIGVNTQRGTAFLSGAATAGSAHQTTLVPGAASIVTVAGRQSLSAAAGTATERGTLELSANFDHSGVGLGLLPYACVLGLRAREIALGTSPQSPTLNAELQYYGWFGDRPALAVARLGLLAPLPTGLMLTVDVERNPFISGLGGSTPWIPVLKVTRTTRIPVGTLRPAAKGEVFEDLNGNGARDQGEPGMAGAIVRRGTETAVTDRSGRFRFYNRSDIPARLDETSLPIGVIPNMATPPGGRVGAIHIGVLRTAQVDVQLVPTADSSGRLPHVELNGIPLQAIDSAGNAWGARTDAGGLAHFYALPPGRYRVQVDVSGLRERVRLGPAPVFTVEPQGAVPLQKVRLFARPIRLFEPGGAGPQGLDGRSNPSPG